MSLFGRHVGKRPLVRVWVPLVGVTLIVALTALPASASTVTSFTPTCGAVGTSVAITGTGFTGMTDVTFDGHSAATETFISDTSATALVPAAATTGKIEVITPNPDTPSASVFVVGAAAAPTITTFTPTVGPVGTAVTITGTNFGCTTAVKFNTTTATSFTLNSATSITATVPAGATTGKISVTNTVSTATSPTDFTVVGVPTIASFTPTYGPVGTSVKITGTNFSGTGFTTTAVTFNSVAATAFTVNSATQITATVPTTTTGPIKVTTPGGTATSPTNFTLSTVHSRTVTLRLSGSLNAAGNVRVSDGFALCRSGVPVKIQRKVSGTWKTVRSATTTATGKYAGHLKNESGKYRAFAPKITRNSFADTCKQAHSPTRTN